MARAPDKRIEQAKEMYLQGQRLVEIASQLNLPEGTVRRWKCTHKWENERSDKKSERSPKRKRGAQPGNKNSSGGPPGNKKAEKYGFFSKYLPEETREIFSAIDQADPLDLLWHQIQLAYAAIIRAQRIAYVKDQQDKTIEKIEEKEGNVIGEKWEVQQAWDKQSNFLKAQARAQGELRSMIKQYDEMLHKNWEAASEEQRVRIAQMKAQTDKLTGNNQEIWDWYDNRQLSSIQIYVIPRLSGGLFHTGITIYPVSGWQEIQYTDPCLVRCHVGKFSCHPHKYRIFRCILKNIRYNLLADDCLYIRSICNIY